jgi:hypothetical protein
VSKRDACAASVAAPFTKSFERAFYRWPLFLAWGAALRRPVFGAVLAVPFVVLGAAHAESPAAQASGVSAQTLDALDLHTAGADNSVTIADGTGEGAHGTLGINAVSGGFNLQANLLAVAAAAVGMADASASVSQTSADLSTDGNSTNSVTGGTDLLREASGNIGLNAVAGAFNMQQNTIVIAAVDVATLATSTAALSQKAHDSSVQAGLSHNSVALETSLFAASGNIGLNFASGTGNSQLNLITLAGREAGL